MKQIKLGGEAPYTLHKVNKQEKPGVLYPGFRGDIVRAICPEGVYDDLEEEIMEGKHLVITSLRRYYMTTPVQEIIHSNDDNTIVMFRTKNNTYIIKAYDIELPLDYPQESGS